MKIFIEERNEQRSFKNVTKIYDSKKVIDNVSLEIKDKEFVVLVGASGCGKSTLLRMIAGLEDITEGEIFIDDKKVNNVHPKDRDIAFVFQSYALYPHMTVRENIAFGLKMRKVDKETIEKKFKKLLKFWIWANIWTENQNNCPADRDSVLLWDVQS